MSLALKWPNSNTILNIYSTKQHERKFQFRNPPITEEIKEHYAEVINLWGKTPAAKAL